MHFNKAIFMWATEFSFHKRAPAGLEAALSHLQTIKGRCCSMWWGDRRAITAWGELAREEPPMGLAGASKSVAVAGACFHSLGLVE